jgi:hypothetical protein
MLPPSQADFKIFHFKKWCGISKSSILKDSVADKPDGISYSYIQEAFLKKHG